MNAELGEPDFSGDDAFDGFGLAVFGVALVCLAIADDLSVLPLFRLCVG